MKAIDTPNLPSTHNFAVHALLSKSIISHNTCCFHALALATSVSNGHLLWAEAKRKTWIYQSIFLSIAIIFTLLAAYIFQSKLYIPFHLFELFSIKTTKIVLTVFTLFLAAWAAWLGFSIQPFKEQITAMENKAKRRLAKYNRNSNNVNKGWREHIFHECEEKIEKAVKSITVEELRIRSLSLPRKQRFLQKAFLLESLENQLEDILVRYKAEVKSILN